MDINRNKIKRSQKFISLAFCTIFASASLLSAAFIITYADHEHNHDGPENSCSTCFNLESTINPPDPCFIPAAKSIAVIFATFNHLRSIRTTFPGIIFYTPVTLKVVLNN